ncbi:YkuJ family protein [Ferdinandcohnia quinoae]|uniref:YkuJ family protein n=1 Tax=Fredinandcohnia quinoae TaxID=2918902 RepID=A0AAW5DZV4_9BACI|nr:YkuJ family protein [Fredinandcohnia sp. SECRCQ15]MCH1623959.1 YkuJ family protein [Fredinandcohnia sp. SECRCQ15]
MTQSQLQGIITRLLSLQENANGGEPPQRFFEVNGERKCSVKYFNKNETFELEVYQQGEKPKTYQFDNIDMIAIEIFDLIN